MELGYGFVWKPREAPILTTPTGVDYVLEVEDFVPVLVNLAADPDKKESVESCLPCTHFLTHTPKDIRCQHCVEAKLTAKPARRRVPDGEHPLDLPSKFGELLVADHIILGKEVEQSLHDDSVVCVVTDIGTGEVMAYPAKTKSANAVKRAFMHFAGANDKIDRLYCDNAKELEGRRRGTWLARRHFDPIQTHIQWCRRALQPARHRRSAHFAACFWIASLFLGLRVPMLLHLA